MDWDKLKIFHAVAEAGSFTSATVNLNLSQSGVNFDQWLCYQNQSTYSTIKRKNWFPFYNEVYPWCRICVDSKLIEYQYSRNLSIPGNRLLQLLSRVLAI